jgi:hypothetical protein
MRTLTLLFISVSAFCQIPETDLIGHWTYEDGIESDSTIDVGTLTIKITNMDWPIDSGYIPLKTNATFTMQSVNTVDTAFWNHAIYPTTSVYSCIDYNNQTFFKIENHRIYTGLNGFYPDSTEINPARITEIAIYSTHKTGADSASLYAYFGVPQLAVTGVRKVGTGKTYSTIMNALNASSDNDTIYVYSGRYAEQNDALSSIYINKSITIQCVGNVLNNPPGGATQRPIYINAASKVVNINGLLTDNTTNNLCFYLVTATDVNLNNMAWTNQSGYFYLHSVAFDLSLNKCLIRNYFSNSGNNGTLTINESLLNVNTNSLVSDFHTNNFNYTLTYNDEINHVIDRMFVPTINQNLTFKFNKINSQVYSIVSAGGLAGNVLIKGNTFTPLEEKAIIYMNNPLISSIVIQGNYLNDSSLETLSDDYFFNFLNAKYVLFEKNTLHTHILAPFNAYTTGIDLDSTYVRDNYFNNLHDIYTVGIGTSTEYNDFGMHNCIVERNYFGGPSAKNGQHACYMGRQAVILRHNFFENCHLTSVAKGDGEDFTGLVGYGNVFYNCNSNLLAKGACNVQYYNNTIVCDDNYPFDDFEYGWLAMENQAGQLSTGSKVYNNAFIFLDTMVFTGAIMNFFYPSCKPGSEINNNFYYCVGNQNAISTEGDGSMATWQGLGYDVNGSETYLYTDSVGKPLYNSPLIGSGKNLGNLYKNGLDMTSSWADSVLLKDQKMVWDVGAWVYGKKYTIKSNNKIATNGSKILIIE